MHGVDKIFNSDAVNLEVIAIPGYLAAIETLRLFTSCCVLIYQLGEGFKLKVVSTTRAPLWRLKSGATLRNEPGRSRTAQRESKRYLKASKSQEYVSVFGSKQWLQQSSG